MRRSLIAVLVLSANLLSLAADVRAEPESYVACSAHLRSADPVWLSIAGRLCTSLRTAAALSAKRDTVEGRQGIHQLYLDTFDVERLVRHVTLRCIQQWGSLDPAQVREIVEREVYRKISGFVLQRPGDFNYVQGAGLQIGPLDRRPGRLLSRIVSQGQVDIDIAWEFTCVEGQCRVVDIVVFGASLSDQVKAALQSRCHR